MKTFSMATVTLIVGRSLIIGSRMLAFIVFALLFHYWLFVIIGFHYCFMFVMVFYQMSLWEEKFGVSVVCTVVTPFIYIFDFCVNCLSGPSRYWYAMVYVPIYCENLLMCALGLWHASNSTNPAWYIVPGCASAIVMFPLGVLAMVLYYRYWHPKNARSENSGGDFSQPTQSTWYQHMSWKEFRADVVKANKINKHAERHASAILRRSGHSVVTTEQKLRASKGPFQQSAVQIRSYARGYGRVRTLSRGVRTAN